MSKYFLCLVALFISAATFADNPYTFRFADTYRLDHSHFNHLRVIDLRADKEDIGYIRTGKFNRYSTIITNKPVSEELTASFDKMLTGSSNENKELVLVLYDLRIEDRPNKSEMGTFHFNGDFFCGSAGQYKFLGRTDSFFEVGVPYPRDVTSKLISTTQDMIAGILYRFAAGPITPASASSFSEEQMIQRRKQEKLKYPIYHADSFKRGIYFTVDQFLNNQPGDTLFETNESSPEEPQFAFYYLKANGKRGERIQEDTYFAIYDGKQWAVSDSVQPLIMDYKDGDFCAKRSFNGIASNGFMMAICLPGLGAVAAVAIAAGTAAGTYLGSRRKTQGLYEAVFDPSIKDFRPIKRLR